MSNSVYGKCTFEDRGHPRVWIAMVVDHNTCPAKTIPGVWYDPGSIMSQPLWGEMGGDDVAIVGSYGFPEKGLCAGKNCLAVGCGREIVDACGRVEKMIVGS